MVATWNPSSLSLLPPAARGETAQRSHTSAGLAHLGHSTAFSWLRATPLPALLPTPLFFQCQFQPESEVQGSHRSGRVTQAGRTTVRPVEVQDCKSDARGSGRACFHLCICETGTDGSSHEDLCDGHSKTQRSARGERSLLSRQVSDPELGWDIKLYTHVAPPKARRLH